MGSGEFKATVFLPGACLAEENHTGFPGDVEEMSAVAELEHFIGYGGKHLNTVRYHPTEARVLPRSDVDAWTCRDVT
eukprot:g23967.t1